MTQLVAQLCERCGAPIYPNVLVCGRCGALAYRAELERLSQEAMALESHDPAGAALRWQRCLQLLPPNAQQYAAIYYRLATLAARFSPHAGGPDAGPYAS